MTWVFQWRVDTAKSKKILVISETEVPEGYVAGHHEMLEFKTPFVGVEEAA